MKKNILLFVVLSSLMVIGGCHFPPELENIPKIDYNDMYFVQNRTVEGQDTTSVYALVLVFDFEDGDGDIGIDNSFTDLKFQEFWYILDEEGNRIKYGTRPDLEPPTYDPLKYHIETRDPKDTVLVERNENHNNLFITLYTKNNGNYIEYDSWANLRQFFNFRIPVMRKDGKSTQGTITYEWESYGWPALLPQDSVQLRFYIKDRELQRSNTLETQDFLIRAEMRNAQIRYKTAQ